MSSIERAPHVCLSCKLRKKACDKQLPCCGYCTKRSLECSYDFGDWSSTDAEVDTFVPLLLFCTPAQAGKLLGLPPTSSPSSETVELDTILNVQVTWNLEAMRVSFHETSERYFHDFQCIIPPADFSVLKLAMHLTITSPPSATFNRSVSDPLYVFVKMLLSQVQAQICASIRLVQASLLLSAYEYACGRPEAAYSSLGTCLGMAYTLRINDYKDLEARSMHETGATLRSREAWNVWWGIVIIQRLILIELCPSNRWPRTEFPDLESPLPSDLAPNELPRETCAKKPFETSRLSTVEASQVSCFGRQAQAVHLFDQVLAITDLPIGGETKVLQLRELDKQIQIFLSLVMAEIALGRWKIRSGIIATTVRTLFALHEETLNQLPKSMMTEDHAKWAEISQATLHTAVKMVVDIAHHHIGQGEDADIAPPCCIYSIRTAHKHAEDRYTTVPDDQSLDQLNTIRALKKNLSFG